MISQLDKIVFTVAAFVAGIPIICSVLCIEFWPQKNVVYARLMAISVCALALLMDYFAVQFVRGISDFK